jgi:hypothetical protein
MLDCADYWDLIATRVSGGALTFAAPLVVAGDGHADDHQWAGNFVLGLTASDGLVADGTGFTSARTPENVMISQWPQRAVNESLADAADEIRVYLSGSFAGADHGGCDGTMNCARRGIPPE